jgi:hypothetical protein
MRLLFILFCFSSFFAARAQTAKGQSDSTTIIIAQLSSEKLLKSKNINQQFGANANTRKCHIVLKPQTIQLDQVTSFLAFSCRWKECNSSNTNSNIFIRFSKDGTTWERFQKMVTDEHADQAAGTSVSTLQFLDKDIRFYQVYISTNRDRKGKIVESLFLNFFNPSKQNGFINQSPNSEVAQRSPQSCPCAQPTYITRTQWNCPQGQGLVPGVGVSSSVTHLIVHHSAGSNTSSDWNAVVLSIWNYHVGTNGWSDIGYNFLVAPNGVLYEGRGGGNNVTGAHFCGFNTGTMGTCMMGTYNTEDITLNARNKLREILAWKCCNSNINPVGSAFHTASGLTLNNISGHQNGCATDCPGTFFFGTLPTLRTEVQTTIAACNTTPVLTVDGAEYTKILPNPSNGNFSVQIKLATAKMVSMQLVDASGKRILQIPAQKRNGISRIPINISGVPAGVYFLQIKINEQTVVEKVVVN